MMLSSKMAITTADCGVVSLDDSGSSTPGAGVMTSPSTTKLLSRKSSSTVRMSIIEVMRSGVWRLRILMGLRPLRRIRLPSYSPGSPSRARRRGAR